MTLRTDQIGSIIHRAIAPQLRQYEPEFGMITITRVEVTPDLADAMIYIEAHDQPIELLAQLHRDRIHLTRATNQHLMQKRTPRLKFKYDTYLDDEIRLMKLLDEPDTPASDNTSAA